jgi:hypothetical protein
MGARPGLSRSTVTAVLMAGLGATLVVAAPTATEASTNKSCTVTGASPTCVQPRLLSLKASRSVVTTDKQQHANRTGTVRLTAVFDDPDQLLFSATFATTAYDHGGVIEEVYDSTRSGTRRTFVVDIEERSDVGAPGRRTITARGELHYSSNVVGFTTPTKQVSYTVRHKPEVVINPLGSMRTTSGQKVQFYGHLAYTTSDANKKLTLAFKKKGTKKFVKRQVVRTDSEGEFRTKRFKNKAVGVWRMSFKGKGDVLKADPGLLRAKRSF